MIINTPTSLGNVLLVYFTPNAVHGPDPQPSVVLVD